MKRISISAELERRLRACKGIDLVDEIIKLLDDSKRAVSSSTPGLGYKELVALFRSELGSNLVLPPAPSPLYIIKTVNKAKELGISKDNVGQIVKGLIKCYPRGPYSLSFVVGSADRHFAAGENRKDEDTSSVGVLYTGRIDHDPDDKP